MLGKIFGRLTVIQDSHKRENGCIVYTCICNCGTYKDVPSTSLRSGHTKSCGCIKRELDSIKGKNRLKGKFSSSFNRIYRTYKRHAVNRNLDFLLTEEQFFDLISKDCFYCNEPPTNKHVEWEDVLIYNGIDRVDNTTGYIVENCVPCCKFCNRAKMNMSYKDFIDWVVKISDNLKLKSII